MSLDVTLSSDEPIISTCTCSCCGHEHETTTFETYFEYNITHNLTEMAEAAGIYNHLWHPEKVGVFCAKDLIKPLEKGLDNLKSNPKKFKKYNPANGWGNYDNLVAFVTNYLVACKTYPNAVISISR